MALREGRDGPRTHGTENVNDLSYHKRIPEENGTIFFNQSRPTKRNGFYHFYSFPEFQI